MYRFNFATDDTACEQEYQEKKKPTIIQNHTGTTNPCRCINIEFDRLNNFQNTKVDSTTIDGICILSCRIDKIKFGDYDIITNSYEGGMKIWEGTHHLIRFLNQNGIDFTGKSVLDLGCGSGFLGIYAGKKNASSLDFQDFNEDVIRKFTSKNVILNNITCPVRFFAGDWSSFGDSTKCFDEPCCYDFILTSETIYNPDNYKKLRNIFKSKLRKTGYIYLIAKSVYFGLNGTTNQFLAELEKELSFEAKIVFTVTRDIKYEIIQISFK